MARVPDRLRERRHREAPHDEARRPSRGRRRRRTRARRRRAPGSSELFANQPVFVENDRLREEQSAARVAAGEPRRHVAVPSRSPSRWDAAPTPPASSRAGRGSRRCRTIGSCCRASSRSRECLSVGILSIAVIMLASAVALIANTLRMGMFARRKEIGIMRLVGATNWRIRVPFLIEGLVESLLGAGGGDLRAVPREGDLHRSAARRDQVLPAGSRTTTCWRSRRGS